MSILGQTVLNLRDGVLERRILPDPDTEVIPGVPWGHFDEFFTPAFWATRAWIDRREEGHESYGLGQSLTEEVAACLLGGHGMPAEVGLAAFERLRDRRLLRADLDRQIIERHLAEPLRVRGRWVRYRYPTQKSRYLELALSRLSVEVPPVDDIAFRDWLVTFEGIGLKTASWITRNHRHCDDVAILDVHIQRAGLIAGVFSSGQRVDRDYLNMETRLVAFSRSLAVRLSVLDSMIWAYMKRLNNLALNTQAA